MMKNIIIVGVILAVILIIMKSMKSGVIENDNSSEPVVKKLMKGLGGNGLSDPAPNPRSGLVKYNTEVKSTTTDLTNAISRGFNVRPEMTSAEPIGHFQLNPMFHVCPNCNR